MAQTLLENDFEFEKETPGTVRYTRDNNGRKETQYVSKAVLPTPYPQRVRVSVSTIDE